MTIKHGESVQTLQEMRAIFSQFCWVSTCKIRMCLSEPKPVHLAITLLKRNLGTSHRFLQLPTVSCHWLFWRFTRLFGRWGINNIKRWGTNCVLLFGYGIIWQIAFPQKTAILIISTVTWYFTFYANTLYISCKFLRLKNTLVNRWVNLSMSID